MKGLILNNFYSMESNIKLSFVMAAILPLLLFGTREFTITPVIIAIQILIFIANTGTSLQVDEISRWNKFEITLPVRRSMIIKAKYISFSLLIFLGLLMSILTLVVLYFTGISTDMRFLIFGYGFGLTLAVTSTALMYPIMLFLGTEKNELFFLISTIFAVCIQLLVTLLMSPMTNGMNFRHPLVAVVSVAISLIIFINSYFISLKIHSKKEF